MRLLDHSFWRFAVVGGLGFMIDAFALWCLLKTDLNIVLARCASFSVAVTFTWWFNKYWSFSQPGNERAKSGHPVLYVGVQLGGLAVNFGVFVTALHFLTASDLNALAALVLASSTGLVFNFFGSSRLVFSH